jgi:hypothetical protein
LLDIAKWDRPRQLFSVRKINRSASESGAAAIGDDDGGDYNAAGIQQLLLQIILQLYAWKF